LRAIQPVKRCFSRVERLMGRPFAIPETSDGGLFVSDDYAGAVYIIIKSP
jgi:hypothetical protein